jgi:glycosyltransferase involved in cell wall biosynthesis
MKLRICFVIDDLSTQSEASDVPSLMPAEWLAHAGHSVTFLLIHPHLGKMISNRNQNSAQAIHLVSLNYQGPSISSLPPAVQSYHLLHWLHENAAAFDVVYFPLAKGMAYYTLLAKHQGWAFQHIEFFVDLHSPTLWHKHKQRQWMDQLDDLAADFLERESVHLTDRIVSCNHDILEWMKQEGWQLPNQIHFLSKEMTQRKEEWLNLHEKIEINAPSIQTEKEHPLVSVCMTHFNRPHYLAQALESIRAQDYPYFEVILVDDASTQPEAQHYLDHLASEFKAKGWQMIRNKKNLFPGAARNLAAQHSRGKYLLFMDDDNYAKVDQISTFVQVNQKVNADILTCAMDVFESVHTPSKEALIHRFLPMGAAAGVGLYLNLFGDMNALIKKEVYMALNGLTEDHGVGGEDWELYGRAVLKGYHLETIPLALFWYRDTPHSITKTTQLHANYMRGIRSYLEVVPPLLRSNLILSQAQQEKLSQLMRDHNHLGKLLKRSWQLFSSRAWHALCHPRKSIKKITKRIIKTLS